MKSIALLVFLLQAIINGVNLAKPPGPGQQVARCQFTGNFKSNSLQKHRDSAFETLSTSIGSPEYTGFHSTQAGTDKKGDKVYALALCSPNVKMEECRDCIKATAPFLKQSCPKQREGATYTSLWRLDCMVRYSDQEIYRKYADWGWAYFSNPTPKVIEHVVKGLNGLASKLMDKAAGGDTHRKFASGSVVYGPDSLTLYGSMQCTPDLKKEECIRCLNNTVVGAYICCTDKGKMSGKVLTPSCFLRYSHDNYL